jgi:transposase-like protein
MHRSCAAQYFLRLSNSNNNATTNKKISYPCPKCKQEWNKNDVSSVVKSTNGIDENGSTTRQSTQVINKKQRTSKTNDHNNSTNNRSVRSSNRRIIDENDDDDDDDN